MQTYISSIRFLAKNMEREKAGLNNSEWIASVRFSKRDMQLIRFNQNQNKMPQQPKISIGSTLLTPHGLSIVTGIEITAPGESDGGIEIAAIWAAHKDICVFDLDNGHWAYGSECELVPQTLTEFSR